MVGDYPHASRLQAQYRTNSNHSMMGGTLKFPLGGVDSALRSPPNKEVWGCHPRAFPFPSFSLRSSAPRGTKWLRRLRDGKDNLPPMTEWLRQISSQAEPAAHAIRVPRASDRFSVRAAASGRCAAGWPKRPLASSPSGASVVILQVSGWPLESIVLYLLSGGG